MENKNKLINLELHPKEYQLIQFFRKQFRFGKVEIIVHNGLPQDYEISKITGRFDGNLGKISDFKI